MDTEKDKADKSQPETHDEPRKGCCSGGYCWRVGRNFDDGGYCSHCSSNYENLGADDEH